MVEWQAQIGKLLYWNTAGAACVFISYILWYARCWRSITSRFTYSKDAVEEHPFGKINLVLTRMVLPLAQFLWILLTEKHKFNLLFDFRQTLRLSYIQQQTTGY